MTDPTNTSETSSSGDWRDQRRAEKHARREAMRGTIGEGWAGVPIAGFAVIGVGIIFLAGNFGLHLPQRWWAIFILLPAVASLVGAIRLSRLDGPFGNRVIGLTISGAMLLVVALTLFLDLSWSYAWPILVIIVGLGIVARGYRR